MRSAIAILSFSTCLISSFIGIMAMGPVLDILPVGAAHFPDTPIQGLTYGEVIASLVLSVVLGFAIGCMHGLVFGKGYLGPVCIAALCPAVLMLFGLAAATMGMGFAAFPLVLAYWLAIWKGTRAGEQLNDRYRNRRQRQDA